MHLSCALTTAIFLTPFVTAAGLYPKSSAVLQVDGRSYDRLIAKSNYTSIVEFYAPWCGHCKNLQPAYEKAAKALQGFAKVAAVNCDEEENKQFCGSMGVQGFPTLKIVKPAKKAGSRGVAEDYNGPRTAKGINDAVLDKMPNHVKKLTDKTLPDWLAQGNETAKGILFTDKTPVSPLMKALAIDFLGSISFAQVKSSEKEAVGTFSITTYPTVLLLPGGTKHAVTYSGDVNKTPLVEFFTQAASPNPDPAPVSPKSKAKSAKAAKASSAAKPDSSAAGSAKPAGHPDSGDDAEACPFKGGAASDTKADASDDTKASTSNAAPATPEIAPLSVLSTAEALQSACLTTTSATCFLAFVPGSADAADAAAPEDPTAAALAAIAFKHNPRSKHARPYFAIPASNTLGATLARALGVPLANDAATVVAVNAKKGWWTDYKSAAVAGKSIETWLDDIRFGDFVKEKLPASVEIVEVVKKAKKVVDEDKPIEIVVEGTDGPDGMEFKVVEEPRDEL